jgi:hypothetical protein
MLIRAIMCALTVGEQLVVRTLTLTPGDLNGNENALLP